MNRRRINILLLLIVVFIWTKIIYDIAHRPQPKNKYEKPTKMVTNEIKQDFFLDKITRDPFLNKRNVSNMLNKKNSDNKKIKKITSKSELLKKKDKRCPKIKYYGYITDYNVNNPILIIQINNKMYKAKLYSKIDNIYIKKFYKDSIFVLCGNNKSIIVAKKQ